MSDFSEATIEDAARELYAANRMFSDMELPDWEDAPVQESYRRAARIHLEALAPLILRPERERIAQEIDAAYLVERQRANDSPPGIVRTECAGAMFALHEFRGAIDDDQDWSYRG